MDALSARPSSYPSWHMNKMCFKPFTSTVASSLIFLNQVYSTWTIDHILLDFDLWGMVNYMHRSLKHTHIQEKTITWCCSNCDWQTMNLLQLYSNWCQLHKNTLTAESHCDLAIIKTKNLCRFLLWSPRVKIILCLSELHMFDSA